METGKYLLIVFKHIYSHRNTILPFFALLFFLWIVVTFMFCKWFKKHINENVHFSDYSPKSLKNINLYGDFQIKNVYIVRESICNSLCVLFNILTFNNYSKQIEEYSREIEDEYFFPKHTYMIVEVEMPNNCIRKIVIDKNPQLCISLYLKLSDCTELMRCNMRKKKITLKELLNNTKNRVGEKDFFNWNIFTNNCQMFTHELLNTMNISKLKYLKFIDQSEFKERFVVINDFTLHILNSFTNVYSFLYSSFIEM